jgi:hypothetical protein
VATQAALARVNRGARSVGVAAGFDVGLDAGVGLGVGAAAAGAFFGGRRCDEVGSVMVFA